MTNALLDELVIRKMMELFMRRMDDQDGHGVASMFTDAGVFRVSGKELVGRDAISGFLLNERQFVGEPVRWQEEGNLLHHPRGIHILSSPIIEIDGDAATAECDCVTVHRDADGHPRLGILCRYRDRLVRSGDGRWLIAERTGVALRKRDPSELEHLPRGVREAT